MLKNKLRFLTVANLCLPLFFALAMFLSCNPEKPINHICKAEIPFDQDSLSASLDSLPSPPKDSQLAMRVQLNFIHFDSTYFASITDSMIERYKVQVDNAFPDFTIQANELAYFYVYPEEFYMEDIEGDKSGLNEAAVLAGKFTEGALNINFVPSMGSTRGYTLPFYYKNHRGELQERGQVAWVDYEVFENPRGLDGWVANSEHEIGHALSLDHHLDSTGFPGIDHGYFDRYMGYAKMKDRWTIDEREQMYLFLFYERQEWHALPF